MGEGGQNSENNEPAQEPVKRVRKSWGQRAAEWGRRTEEEVVRSFEDPDLKEERPSWFKGFRRATPEEDKGGIADAWIDTDEGPVPVQVKSSWIGAKKAQDALGKSRSGKIAYVIARPDLPHQTIFDRCLEAVGRIRDARLKAKEQENE